LTFATLLARTGHKPWLSFQVAGFGPSSSAVAATQAYRYTSGPMTRSITSGNIDPAACMVAMTGVPSAITERIDLLAGSTDLSALSLQLRTSLATDDLWRRWSTHRTMTGYPLDVFRYALVATIGAAAVSMHLDADPLAGLPAAGRVVHLGGEAILITAIDGGGVCDIVRGMYGTTATAHVAGNKAWNVPTYLRGRRCWLRLNFIDEFGTVLDSSEEATLWTGSVDEWEMKAPGVLSVACKPHLGRMDRAIGRHPWSGTVSGMRRIGETWDAVPIRGTLDLALSEGASPAPAGTRYEDADHNWCIDFYARVGKSLCLCRVKAASETADPSGAVEILDIGLLGTSVEEFEELPEGKGQVKTGDDVEDIREVLCAHPSPREFLPAGETALAQFILHDDTVATTHPIDLMLALMTSTGTSGVNEHWDILDSRWSAEIPYTDIDLDSFRALKEATATLSFPNLIIGWEGKPIKLRDWITQEILSPLGWFLHQSIAGLIAIDRIQDMYPDDTCTTIEEHDIVPGSISISGGLPDAVTHQTWLYGYDWGTEKYTRTRYYSSDFGGADTIDDDGDITIECKGIDGGESVGATLLGHRASQLTYWWASPMPRMSLSVHLRTFQSFAVGGRVTFSGLDWPNPLTGESAWAAGENYGIIESLGRDLMGAKVDMAVRLLPASETTEWSPAARVTSWDGAAHSVHVALTDFSDDDDASYFHAGELVALYDADGLPLCDSAGLRTIASVAAGEILIGGHFQIGGVNIDPNAGDIIAYPRVNAAAEPDGVWVAEMLTTAAQADAAGAMPDGSNARVYGA